MNKTFLLLLISLFVFASVVFAVEDSPYGDTTYAELQEIYATGQALSPDIGLPLNFVRDEVILQELYAQNWGVSPNMIISSNDISSHAILEELYAQNWGVSPNMDISE